MKIKKSVHVAEQIAFSSLLFDSLFGLVLFFSMDSFLDIKDPAHFIFYLFSTIILVHWWLIFKSVDDIHGKEVNNSLIDLVLGIGYVIFLEYVVLYAKEFDYLMATKFLLAVFLLDLIWALLWRYVGKWYARNKTHIGEMESELDIDIRLSLLMVVLLGVTLWLGQYLNAWQFVVVFVVEYLFYMFLTFKYQIIDIDLF